MGRPQFFSPVERPGDTATRENAVEYGYEVKDVTAFSTISMIDSAETSFDGDTVTSVSGGVESWDRNGDNNEIIPGAVALEVHLEDSNGNTVLKYGKQLLSGDVAFEPNLKIPSGGRVKVNAINRTGNDIRVTATVVVI